LHLKSFPKPELIFYAPISKKGRFSKGGPMLRKINPLKVKKILLLWLKYELGLKWAGNPPFVKS